MKIIVLPIIVVAILLSGCVGVNGEPLVIPDGQELYGDGFVDGCMTSILALTSPQNLPPYGEALQTCKKIYLHALEGNFGQMPSEMSAPVAPKVPTVVCEGNCI